MKKLLLSIAGTALLSATVFAQGGYHYLKTTGTTSEYSMSSAANTTTLLNATTPQTDFISSITAIPFVWRFYGNIVQSFRASTSGYITFNNLQSNDFATNVTLPDPSAPTNAIFAFWDSTVMSPVTQGSNTFPSDIRYWTYGTAPSRVFVIQWRLVQKGAVSNQPTNVSYHAIRLYEANGGNTFDIIHNYGFGTFDATVGCQNSNGTEATQLPASPLINFGGNSGSYDASLSDVYTFTYRTNQPSFDLTTINCTTQEYLQKATNYSLTGSIGNWGRNAVTSFTLNYSVNGGAAISANITNVNITSKGGSYTYAHPTSLNIPTSGTVTVKIWTSNINGTETDGDMSNDTVTRVFTVLDQIAPRQSLFEVFTSSTCPPCRPGNETLDGVLNQAQNAGKFTVIKYQYNFPPPGDPYYTLEGQARGTYYGGISSVPNLFIDGGWDDNPNIFTQSIFNQFQTKPALVSIQATQAINDKTFTANITVTPLVNLSNVTLRTAIVERRTTQNVKNNGETEFFWVMKRVMPSTGGEFISQLTANVPQGYTHEYTFNGDYRLPANASSPIDLNSEHSVEQFNDLIGVVFLQNDQTKEVLQSAWTSANYNSVRDIPLADLGATVYPNPAQSEFTIKLESAGNGTVTIFDISGKVVMTTELTEMEHKVDCSSLINGLYMVEIVVDGKKTVKKLNIAH